MKRPQGTGHALFVTSECTMPLPLKFGSSEGHVVVVEDVAITAACPQHFVRASDGFSLFVRGRETFCHNVKRRWLLCGRAVKQQSQGV